MLCHCKPLKLVPFVPLEELSQSLPCHLLDGYLPSVHYLVLRLRDYYHHLWVVYIDVKVMHELCEELVVWLNI